MEFLKGGCPRRSRRHGFLPDGQHFLYFAYQGANNGGDSRLPREKMSSSIWG
jgi:hypothetical protein